MEGSQLCSTPYVGCVGVHTSPSQTVTECAHARSWVKVAEAERQTYLYGGMEGRKAKAERLTGGPVCVCVSLCVCVCAHTPFRLFALVRVSTQGAIGSTLKLARYVLLPDTICRVYRPRYREEEVPAVDLTINTCHALLFYMTC